MNFANFLGNGTLKERLSTAESRGQLSHSYLLTGPVGSGKRTLARIIGAAMECTGCQKPCLSCAQCKKVLDGAHPDLITVDDEERKTIPVKAVREACADLYIRPNEGAKKIYLFPRAQDLNQQGQNALLKCMEEPPAYGVFLLLAEHAEQLLPTIRSRCVELHLAPLSEELLYGEMKKRFPKEDEAALRAALAGSGGYLGQAISALEKSAALLPQTAAFVQALSSGSELALLQVLTPMEKLKREQLRPVLLQWYRLLASAATNQRGMPPLCPEAAQLARACPAPQLMSALELLRRALELAEANVGTAHICGLLSVRLFQPKS